MKLKAYSPLSRLTKESTSGTFPPSGAAQKLRHIYCLCLFFRPENPSLYQQCSASHVENSKPTGYLMTTAMSVSKFTYTEQSLVTQWLLPIQNCPVSSSPSVLIWYVLRRESKFPWIICGPQWSVGRRRSLQLRVRFLLCSSLCW